MKITTLQSGKKVAIIADDSHISHWVKESGRLDHDQNTLPLLDKWIHKGNTVVDVGGFIGDHTEYYRQRVGMTGKVYAFEPNKDAFDCLTYNMSQYNNVACLNVGASDKSENITLNHNINAGATFATQGGDIPCITIDSLNLQECHFIKIDCEGFELKVLNGAKQTIETFNPAMLIEINRGALNRQGIDSDAVLTWLSDAGYLYQNIYPGQGFKDEQFDVICWAKSTVKL